MEENLLRDVKDYLNISYEDELTDRMLAGAIERGRKVIDDYAGREEDYGTEGAAKQLLLDYCRYVRSQATEMFEVNYQRDLIALREMAAMEEAAKEGGT